MAVRGKNMGERLADAGGSAGDESHGLHGWLLAVNV
jgi:hypothetical protein